MIARPRCCRAQAQVPVIPWLRCKALTAKAQSACSLPFHELIQLNGCCLGAGKHPGSATTKVISVLCIRRAPVVVRRAESCGLVPAHAKARRCAQCEKCQFRKVTRSRR